LTIFLNETFTGTAGTRLEVYNESWVKMTSLVDSATIASGGERARSNGTAGYYRIDAPAPSADYSVSADIFVSSVAGYGGPCGRVSSTAQTFYQVRYLANTGLQLVRYLNGGVTTLATFNYAAVAGETLKVRLEMIGSALKVYFNGGATPVISVTDTNITQPGYIGVRWQNAASGQIQIDNLIGSTPDEAGATTTVSPTAAALVVAGYAPSIAQTANQDVSPAPAALVVTGYAPTVAQTSSSAISPAPAALVVQGYAPTISQTQRLTVSPAPAGLVVQGWAPTITQTGTQPLPDVTPAPAGRGGGGGSVREVRAFADELDRARRPTKAEKKRRRQAIEAAVLELLPDVPAAERAAPVIAQMVARELPPATWAPIRGPRPVVLPPAVVDDVHARVAAWLAEQAHQALLADLEDDFEVELLLLG